MNKAIFVIAAILGAILSGQCAIWGACLGGHNPKAGYPFPDLKGIVLFFIGVSAIPLGVAAFVTIVRRFFSSRRTSIPISIPIAILLLGPLFSLVMGYSVQARDNRARGKEREFYARQKEAYSDYAAQVIADPGVVLRERWYEEVVQTPENGARASARRMVFEDSFRPDHLAVAYTGDQLREISELAQEERLFVVSHPMCPPELIESLWCAVLSYRDSWLIDAMIHNPATPRHLFEAYRAEQLKRGRPVNSWIDREIEKRIQEAK